MNVSNSRGVVTAAISTGTLLAFVVAIHVVAEAADGTTSSAYDGRTASLSTKLP